MTDYEAYSQSCFAIETNIKLTKALFSSGEELECNLKDLRPATDYHVRVYAVYNSVKGSCSEPVSFTTHSCAPECPFPPKLAHRSKSSLTLQWKVGSSKCQK